MSYQGNAEIKIGEEILSSLSVEGFDQTGRSTKKMVCVELLIVVSIKCLQYIGMKTECDKTSLLHFYAPFWVVNKTGLNLEYEHQVTSVLVI